MSVGREAWRRFCAIETIVDAAIAKRAASERARRATTEPAYKKAWLEVRLLCECGNGYFIRFEAGHKRARFFRCTAAPACDLYLDPTSYCTAKGEVCAAIVEGTEPRYAYDLIPYRRKRRKVRTPP